MVLQFALAKIGAILVTINTALRAQEIEYLLRQSETSTLVTIAGFRSVDYLAELRSIGAIGSDDVRKERLPAPRTGGVCRPDCPDGLIPYEALATAAANVPPTDLDALESAIDLDDVINMQFTSGTTGFPKGVSCRAATSSTTASGLARALALRQTTGCVCASRYFTVSGA